MATSEEAIDDLLGVRLYPPYSQSSLMAFLITFEPAATKSGLFPTKDIDVKHAKGRVFLETLPTIIRDAVIKHVPNDQPLTFGLLRSAYLKVARGLRNDNLDYGPQPWHRAIERLVPGKQVKWPAAKSLEARTNGSAAQGTLHSSSDEDTSDTSFSSTDLDTTSEWDTSDSDDTGSESDTTTEAPRRSDSVQVARMDEAPTDANPNQPAPGAQPEAVDVLQAPASLIGTPAPKLYDGPATPGRQFSSHCFYCYDEGHVLDDCPGPVLGKKPPRRLALHCSANPIGTVQAELDTGFFIGSPTVDPWRPTIATPATIFFAPYATVANQVHVVRDLGLLTDTMPIEKVIIQGFGSNTAVQSTLKGSIHIQCGDYATANYDKKYTTIISDVYYAPDSPCNVLSLKTLGTEWKIRESSRVLDHPDGELVLSRFPNGLLAAQIPCIPEGYDISPPPQWNKESSACIGYRLFQPTGVAQDTPLPGAALVAGDLKPAGTNPTDQTDVVPTSDYNSLSDALKSARDHLPVGDRAGLDEIVASALEKITTFLQAQPTVSDKHASSIGPVNTAPTEPRPSSSAPAGPAQQATDPAELGVALPIILPTAMRGVITESAEVDEDDEEPVNSPLTVHTSTGEFITRHYSSAAGITLVLDDTASHHIMRDFGMLVGVSSSPAVEFRSDNFKIGGSLVTAGKLCICDKEDADENFSVEITNLYVDPGWNTGTFSNILSERLLLEQGFVRHTSGSGTRHLYHTTSGLCFNIHDRGGQDVILATAWWGWQ